MMQVLTMPNQGKKKDKAFSSSSSLCVSKLTYITVHRKKDFAQIFFLRQALFEKRPTAWLLFFFFRQIPSFKEKKISNFYKDVSYSYSTFRRHHTKRGQEFGRF